MVKFIQEGLWRCFFMGKHKKQTLEDRAKIVKEFKKGVTISYLNNKYDISGCGTVSRWNQEYDEGRLGVDNHGKRKSQQVIENIDILKKSNALLMGIRSQHHKQKNIKLLID